MRTTAEPATAARVERMRTGRAWAFKVVCGIRILLRFGSVRLAAMLGGSACQYPNADRPALTGTVRTGIVERFPPATQRLAVTTSG
jgi:hypothetical protein